MRLFPFGRVNCFRKWRLTKRRGVSQTSPPLQINRCKRENFLTRDPWTILLTWETVTGINRPLWSYDHISTLVQSKMKTKSLSLPWEWIKTSFLLPKDALIVLRLIVFDLVVEKKKIHQGLSNMSSFWCQVCTRFIWNWRSGCGKNYLLIDVVKSLMSQLKTEVALRMKKKTFAIISP